MPVGPTETLCRYIFSKDWFDVEEKVVLATVFMPRYNQESSKNETSVFRVSSLNEGSIWAQGAEVEVARKRKGLRHSLKARADVVAQRAFDEGLTVEPETSEFELHCNLLGWPPDESAQNAIALEIANASCLAVVPKA